MSEGTVIQLAGVYVYVDGEGERHEVIGWYLKYGCWIPIVWNGEGPRLIMRMDANGKIEKVR
jgi:hypothetical protein